MLVVGFLNKGVVLARLRAYIQKACSPIPHSKMKMPAIRINIIAEAMPSGTLTCKAIPAMMSIPPPMEETGLSQHDLGWCVQLSFSLYINLHFFLSAH